MKLPLLLSLIALLTLPNNALAQDCDVDLESISITAQDGDASLELFEVIFRTDCPDGFNIEIRSADDPDFRIVHEAQPTLLEADPDVPNRFIGQIPRANDSFDGRWVPGEDVFLRLPNPVGVISNVVTVDIDLRLSSVTVEDEYLRVRFAKSSSDFATLVDTDMEDLTEVAALFAERGAINEVHLPRAFFPDIQVGSRVALTIPRAPDDHLSNFVTVSPPASALACILSESTLNTGDRGILSSDEVYAATFARAGSGTRISGDLLSQGNIVIADRVSISGGVTAVGTIDVGSGTSLGSVDSSFPVAFQTIALRPSGPGGPDLTTQHHAQFNLPPGDWGNVTVRAGTTLALTLPGEYSFTSLTLESDVTVRLDTSLGSYDLNVEGDIAFGDRLTFQDFLGNQNGVDSSLVSIYSGGSRVKIGGSANISAQITAPDAGITMASRSVIQGCVRGQSIKLHSDARIFQN